MRCPIAIVGMACRYPDAESTEQLLENSLAQRQSFRLIPDSRLSSRYFDGSGRSPDHSYARQAAVLEGFEFDRDWFRISRASYDVTDLTHWLALTVARDAIDDVAFREGARHPDRDGVRVVIANTLTGEFSRAGLMRLRWPYVQRVVEQTLRDQGPAMADADLDRVVAAIEANYKAPFPVPNEDSLAGGLANTIAGRIANHFDFGGGCYSVDGACASSLLAVTDACSALAAGDAEMVVAGAVDLSLDPFELVGFSRSEALARTEMRVYDRHSQGFWPGEGSGFVVLMRYDDAVVQCQRIYGVIRGWGISSDGRGGLTRPRADGQMLALRRCYQSAGYGMDAVGYFEGHGTGTRVGDTAELEALIRVRSEAGGFPPPAVISSIKANIGHTKAAAGLAGLLRATMCLVEGVLPPTTGCRDPHPLLEDNPGGLCVADEPRAWPVDGRARRAGVSASGFGGINTHLTLESPPLTSGRQRPGIDPTRLARARGAQDAELFIFAASRRADLSWTVAHVAGFAASCSQAELVDLAVELARRATRGALSPWRAAVVATTPAELHRRLGLLGIATEAIGEEEVSLAPEDGVFLSAGDVRGRIGFVFSGQGSPARASAGAFARRFPEVANAWNAANLDAFDEQSNTDFAQVAIATASLGGLALLERVGTTAHVALGHSLGELTAMHWSGIYDGPELLRIARARGAAMASDPDAAGSMIALPFDAEVAAAVVADHAGTFVANLNGPSQTVISGPREAIEALVDDLGRRGMGASVLRIAQAFHTPAMAGAAARLMEALDGFEGLGGVGRVLSTVTGTWLPATLDLGAHLGRQMVAPVRFTEAANTMACEVDLFLEVGPGAVLTNLLRGFVTPPALSLDIGGTSFAPMLGAVGAAYVLGRAPAIAKLFDDRFARRFDWSWNPRFLSNPCEAEARQDRPITVPPVAELANGESSSNTERLRALIAEHTGLPGWVIEDSSRMLSDLHLNSITVGEIIVGFLIALDVVVPPIDSTEYSDARVVDIVAGIDRLIASSDGTARAPLAPAGVSHWVRPFALHPYLAEALPPADGLSQGVWEEVGAVHKGGGRLLGPLNRGPYGDGVLVWIDPEANEATSIEALLEGARRCRNRAATGRALFVVVQPGWGGGGFARSWFLEEGTDTLVVNVPPDGKDRTALLLAEITGRHPRSAQDQLDQDLVAAFAEVTFDREDVRTEHRLVPLVPTTEDPLPVGSDDLILITGGGKGISAECARHLARETGCALLVVGRSQPGADEELASNLERLRADDIEVSYRSVDVTDGEALKRAIAEGVAERGRPVTGVVHGAGINEPRMIVDLTESQVGATVAPKVAGLRNVLAAVVPGDLRLLVTFSSIIARIGLRGEADYALANEWLSRATEAFAAEHPQCRCRALEWSVWSGTGMGHRLGRVDLLRAQGISPITVDDGLAAFRAVVATKNLPTAIVVTGRFGAPPTRSWPSLVHPGYRFIESTPVSYPGVELVASCTLSPETDPYVDDHVLDRERILPAVMALEAMTEVVMAVTGRTEAHWRPCFEEVRFRSAIVVGGGPEGITLQLAALVELDGSISLAIRSSATRFLTNHVEARCRLKPDTGEGPVAGAGILEADSAGSNPGIEPARALYRDVVFQRGRFERVAGYTKVEARRCAATLSSDGAAPWFSSKVRPANLVLGDPGARDAALHAIQACIPHKVVVPVAVAEIATGRLVPTTSYTVAAVERADQGDLLIYDVDIVDPTGRVVERWRDLELRVVGGAPRFRLRSPALVAPYIERWMAEREPMLDLRVRMTSTAGPERPPVSDNIHRPDGRPDPGVDGRARSRSYSGDWCLEVSGTGPTGCDLQEINRRGTAVWTGLLGEHGMALAEVVSEQGSEAFDISATRVWTAREALKKAGMPTDTALVIESDPTAPWVVLGAGHCRVYSTVIDDDIADRARLTAVAIAVRTAGAI